MCPFLVTTEKNSHFNDKLVCRLCLFSLVCYLSSDFALNLMHSQHSVFVVMAWHDVLTSAKDPLHKWHLHLNSNTYTSLVSHSWQKILSWNTSMRLRMYKVLLFKSRRHLCKGSITQEDQMDVLQKLQKFLHDHWPFFIVNKWTIWRKIQSISQFFSSQDCQISWQIYLLSCWLVDPLTELSLKMKFMINSRPDTWQTIT